MFKLSNVVIKLKVKKVKVKNFQNLCSKFLKMPNLVIKKVKENKKRSEIKNQKSR